MSLFDLLMPSACAGCGRYGDLLCDGCRMSLTPASRAGDCFLAADGGWVIGESFEVAAAAFAYHGPLRRALQRLKYVGARRAASPLAEAALPALCRLVAISDQLPLAPVPLHAERERVRGYNQAALLTAALAQAAHLPWSTLLVRIRATTKQHHLDRAGRLRNLRGAFAIAPKGRPPPAVILVDDILTTSATLDACASVLREAGCERVFGFTIAREL
ncbi:MAG: ComF family protein [Chloroflexota bacterium]|nr:ComF family protein [Chloroflexota bacterium]